jgi:hypothetical protein
VAQSLFTNRRGLHPVTPTVSQLKDLNVDNFEVEVQVGDVWVRGSVQARRSTHGQWEALVSYPSGPGAALTGWFSSRRIRAIHEPEE